MAKLDQMPPEERRIWGKQNTEPTQIFDDVYYVGRNGVGIFVIPTSEGIVLIDSMDPVDADEKHIIPGMKALGLGPAEIKLVIITHGHGDHFAGAKRLQNKFGCKVCLGETDTAFMMNSMLMDSIDKVEYPHIDFFIEDRKPIVVGDHTFIPVLTPGHTPGCMSLIFNCHSKGEEHWVSLWGGAGLTMSRMPMVEKMDWATQFAASAVLFQSVCDEYNCDVVLGVHPHRCDLFEKLEARTPDGPNPFIVGREGVRANLHLRGSEALEVAKKNLDQM